MPSRMRAVRMSSSIRLMPDEKVEALTAAAETYVYTYIALHQTSRNRVVMITRLPPLCLIGDVSIGMLS